MFSSDERSSLFAPRFSDDVKKSFMALSSAVPLTLPRKSQQQINYKNNKSFSVKVVKPFKRFQSESLIKLFFCYVIPIPGNKLDRLPTVHHFPALSHRV